MTRQLTFKLAYVILLYEVMHIITKELIDRINFLARKQRSEGLSQSEKAEQQQLRQQYIQGIRAQVVDALEQIKKSEPEDCHCGCGHEHKHNHKHH